MNYKNISNQQLIEKINNLKAERERTADCLKELEDELEKRKQKEPLGVPLDSYASGKILGTFYFSFNSNKSKKLFDERLEEYVKALQKLAKGEQIDIKVLLPLLPKGWVAMDKDGHWYWYEEKPTYYKNEAVWTPVNGCFNLFAFNIKPADDWRESLMECEI